MTDSGQQQATQQRDGYNGERSVTPVPVTCEPKLTPLLHSSQQSCRTRGNLVGWVDKKLGASDSFALIWHSTETHRFSKIGVEVRRLGSIELVWSFSERNFPGTSAGQLVSGHTGQYVDAAAVTVTLEEKEEKTVDALSNRFAGEAPLHTSVLQRSEDDQKSLPGTASPASSDDKLPFLRPVSPESVDRLAHFLQLPDLSALALSNFTSQLTGANVVQEYFSETSECYDELCEATLKFLVQHVIAVRDTEAFEKVASRAEANELEEGEGRMWAKLAQRMVAEKA
ncbi:hypothetical protein JCM11641_002837 [Rhodosporidiobolus odoratus]